MTMTEATKATHGFQTEVSQLLDLVTHSLYSNKEIFLRELISNAADAADKLRFKALSDNSLFEKDGELKVRIYIDKENNTLTVADNGIGMSKDEIIENLGTIAKSGTKEFFSKLSGDQVKDSNLIGQFGVGFYSAFIVADKVTVKSRSAGASASEGTVWESDGKSEFSTEQIELAERGTSITLHLKEGESEFLQDYRVRSIVSKYSDHINIPVEMAKIEMPPMEDEKEDSAEDNTEAEKAPEYEVVNQAKALWTMAKSEVSEEQYKEFYKHISHDFEEPLTWAHNKVEGKLEYTSLLYVPKNPPFDIWNRDQKHGLKLYVQRVFIMDDAEQFMPTYLRFVKGVIDSNDLPLNVSREILQDSKITRDLRKGCVKRVLSTLSKLSKNKPDEYQTFWNGFGQILKEGPAEDAGNKEEIAKLLRFSSTETDESAQNVSLEDYIGRMKEGQDKIYYVTGESFAAVKNSPHLEVFRKKGIEVLLLSERIDDWLMSHLTEFSENKFQSVTRGKLDLGELDSEEEKEKVEQTEKEFESLISQIKDSLGERVKEVRITHRLTDSPACVVGDEQDMGSQMAMLLKAAGQEVPESKPVFEVNTGHTLIERLSEEQDDERFGQWVDILFEQALLAERGHLEDPAGFVGRLNRLLQQLAK